MASPKRGPYRATPNRVISRDQLDNLRAAWAFAHARGWSFGRFITLNYGLSPNPERMGPAFARVRALAVRSFRYEAECGRLGSDEFAFLWACEQKGDWPHVHWLVHLPKSHEGWFFDRLPDWLLRTSGVCERRFYHQRHAGYGALAYLSKGCHPNDYEGPEDFRSEEGAQGSFQIKRVGVSLNLGPSARERFRQRGRTMR